MNQVLLTAVLAGMVTLTACSGGSSPSAPAETGGNPTAPNATVPSPTALQVIASQNTSISLRWSDENQAAGYDILRDGTKVATLDAGLFTFVDNNLQPGQSYQYQVVAFNQSGQRSAAVSLSASTVNNNAPQVSSTSGLIQIQDTAALNSPVTQVIATDQDGHDLSFSISAGDEDNLFTIDNQGQITLAKSAASLGGQVFNLTLDVSDGYSLTSASVQIGIVPVSASADNQGLMRQVFTGGDLGSSLDSLKNHPGFPSSPNQTSFENSFVAPSDVANNYGQRMHGYLVPKVSGEYFFWIASDDQSELLLSTNDSAANAQKIAQVSGWVSAQSFGGGEQASVGIQLEAGKAYYISALMTEGGGGDHLAVAWQGPGISQRIIAGEYLRPPLDTQAPEKVTDLRAVKTADDEILLEWTAAIDDSGIDLYKVFNGNTELATLDKATIETSGTQIEMTGLLSGKKYNFQVKAFDKAGNRSSASNVAAVIIDDFIAPSIPGNVQITSISLNSAELNWQASSDENNQSVVYKIFINGDLFASTHETSYLLKQLNPTTEYSVTLKSLDVAGNASALTEALAFTTLTPEIDAPVFLHHHYQAGLSATDAVDTTFFTLDVSDPNQIPLTLSITQGNSDGHFSINNEGQLSLAKAFTADESNTFNLQISASNGEKSSVADVAIVVMASSRYTQKGVSQQIWTGIGGSDIADINLTLNPNSENQLTDFKSVSGMGNSYGQRVRGYLKVPTTGLYSFWIASDDASELRISSDMTPDKTQLIAQINGYTSIDNWRDGYRVKTNIPLNAGQLYYIEALHKEGGGGDHLSVAWQGGNEGEGEGIANKTLLTGEYLLPLSSAYASAPELNNLYQTNFNDQGKTLQLEFILQDSAANLPVNIYYGEMDGGTSAGAWQSVVNAGSLSAGQHSVALPNIEPGKTYFVRIEVQGPAGSSWSVAPLQVDTQIIDASKTAGEALPQQISLTVTIDDQEQHIELDKHSVRSPNYQLLTFDDRRQQQYQAVVPMPEPRTYRGRITNNEFVVVTGVVDAAGTLHLSGWRGDGRVWGHNEDINHLIDENALGNNETSTAELILDFEMPATENNRYYLPQPGSDFHNNLARVSFKHENPQFVSKADGNIINAIAQMENHINETDYVWTQKTGLRWDMGKALIEVHGNSTAEGVQSRPLARDDTNFTIEFQDPVNGGYCWGGGDWVGCVANYTLNWGYTHEIGHNMGLGHGEQTDNNNQIQQPGTHMGNMQARKTTRRLQTGSKFKASKAVMAPMLPAAFKDYLSVYQNAAGNLNPLANDYDANGEALSIVAFDTGTQAGGTVSAEGNVLTYTPPTDFIGVDQFTYTVSDGHYKTVGPVQIQVLKNGLVGDWNMETISDNKITDASGENNHLEAPDLSKITPATTLDAVRETGIDNNAMTIPLLADGTKADDALGHSLLPHKLDPGHKSFTASLWFKYSELAGSKLLMGKSSAGPNNMQYGGWEIRSGGDAGNDLTLQVNFRDRLMENNQLAITKAAAISDANWHHVVLVIDRETGELRGYLDGVAFDQAGVLPTGSGPIMAAMNSSGYGGGSPFKVGGHTSVNCVAGANEGDPETCTIAAGQAFDKARVYHKALTAEEVSALYNP